MEGERQKERKKKEERKKERGKDITVKKAQEQEENDFSL